MTGQGIPIAVRHIESIVRCAESHARMHLRKAVNDEDVDVAIRVMLESFIGSQKYSVQRSLQRRFRKYMTYKKDFNELLLHTLRQLVRDQVLLLPPSPAHARTHALAHARTHALSHARTPFPCQARYEEATTGRRTDTIRVKKKSFEAAARKFGVPDLSVFYDSEMFSAYGFAIDHDAGNIVCAES